MVLHRTPRIVVVGGGFGGLEAAFRLSQRLGNRAEIEVISEDDSFVFRPNAIYVPFGLDPERLRTPVAEPLRSRGIYFIQGRVDDIDPHRRTVRVDRRIIGWDYLIIATGAAGRPAEVDGLGDHANLVGSSDAIVTLRHRFEQLLESARLGRRRRVTFLLPPAVGWPVPLYEIAFMLDTWLTRHGARDAIEMFFLTHESSYAASFGSRLGEFIETEFERRGIHGRRGYRVDRVGPQRVIAGDGDAVPFDLLISMAPQVAAARFPALPSDARGFITTDLATRNVVGHPNVYAIGDAADFPLKQAHLAATQAGVAADQIAASILLEPTRETFEPVGMVVLEQLDRGTFVQAPLRATTRPGEIEVAEDDTAYRVGSSPLWRAGKVMMGGYMPWRFRRGVPARTGVPWRGLEVGLEAMARTLAR
jgi:NADH dehydrogenase FAD-containing subunit